jgi:uncharacterized protein
VGIDAQIKSLEALVEIDAEIKSLSEQLQKERGGIDGVRAEVNDLTERIAADSGAIAEMEKTRSDLLQELRQNDKQVERSRDRLNRSRNEREVNAAERELDELRKLRRDREHESRKLSELCEQARTSVETNQARCDELKAQFEGSIEGVTKSIDDLDKSLAAKTVGRGGIAEKLPSLLGRRYDAMHRRGKVPVSTSRDGTCEGCFVKLPPMLFHQMLSRTRFEECPMCHRIIYYTPPGQAASEDAEGSGEAEAAADGAAT